MEYILKGELNSKLVLFLHGWGGDKNSFASCFNFLHSYGYSVLSVDLSGFGDNKPLEKEYTIFDYASNLMILLNSLNITEFYVVCHSFGARVLAIINSYYQIDKIVITGGAGLKSNFNIIVWLKISFYKILKNLVKLKLLPKNILLKFGSSDYKNLPQTMKKTFINVVNQDLKLYFKNIKGKTLLFWGKNDKETPIYMAKKLNKYIKNSTLLIENGSHFAYIENDFLFCNKVLEFFKGEL